MRAFCCKQARRISGFSSYTRLYLRWAGWLLRPSRQWDIRIDHSQKHGAYELSSDTSPAIQPQRTIMGDVLYRPVEFLDIADAGLRADIHQNQNGLAVQQCFQPGDHIAKLLQIPQSLDEMPAHKPGKLIGELCQCGCIKTDRRIAHSSGRDASFQKGVGIV